MVFTHAVFGPGLASGQVSLALSSGSANLSGTVSLNLNVASTPGNEPAGVEWTLAYPAGDVVPASVGAAAGSALTVAGKSIYCNGRIGTITCLGVGLNANPITNGVAAVVTLSLAPATASSILPISIGGTIAVLGNGASNAAAELDERQGGERTGTEQERAGFGDSGRIDRGRIGRSDIIDSKAGST